MMAVETRFWNLAAHLLLVISAVAESGSQNKASPYVLKSEIGKFYPSTYYPPKYRSKIVRLTPISLENKFNYEDDSYTRLLALSEKLRFVPHKNPVGDLKYVASSKSGDYTASETGSDDKQKKPHERKSKRKKKQKKFNKRKKSELSGGQAKITKKYISSGGGSHEYKYRKQKGDEGNRRYKKESLYNIGKKNSYGRKFGDEKKKKEKKSSLHHVEYPEYDEEENEEEKSPSKSILTDSNPDEPSESKERAQ